MRIPAILAAAAFIAVSPANAAEIAPVDDVVNSAAMCILSAGRDGTDTSRFDTEAWAPHGRGYRHKTVPISIEFPTDDDGISRICVVHAMLRDQDEQKEIVTRLNSMLGSKPLKQSASQVWMVSTASGPRGIQFFTDQDSDQPQVRLIGAAF